MSDDMPLPFDLPSVCRKKLTVDFNGGNQSSDGGLLLLREKERTLGVCRRLADAMPHNANKAGEYGDASSHPQAGRSTAPSESSATASTLTEENASPKVGENGATIGLNPTNAPLRPALRPCWR